ncbi:hypothetical protein B0H14DRAFT_3137544 [Mycena olivaceomarginata]|nr:hypothetical protein B0H14DRAFT_3137544 [Mycena olivaceomarginata]
MYYFLCPHPAPPIQVLSPISAHRLSLDISALDTDDARNCPAVVICNRSTIPARESPPSALFTRVLTIYDNRWWRDENERKGGMSTAGSQRITTDDTLRDEVAGDGGRGDGIERVKTGWFAVLVAVPAVNELIEKMREGWAEKWNTLGLETEHVEVQCSNLSTIAVFAVLRVGGQVIAFPRFFVGGNRVFSLNFGVLEGLELRGPCGIVEEGKKEARGSEKEASRIGGIIRSVLKRSSCALPSTFNDLGQRAENEMFHLHHPATCTRFRGPQCCRKSTSLTPVRGFGLRGMAGMTSTLPSASFIRTNVIQYLRSTEQVEFGVEARFEAEQVVKCVDEPESRAPPRN